MSIIPTLTTIICTLFPVVCTLKTPRLFVPFFQLFVPLPRTFVLVASPRLFGPLPTLFAAHPFRHPLSKSGASVVDLPCCPCCLQCVTRAARDGIRNERATKTRTRPPKACEGSGMACRAYVHAHAHGCHHAHPTRLCLVCEWSGCCRRRTCLHSGPVLRVALLVWCTLHVRMLHCGCCMPLAVFACCTFITG